MIVKQTAGADAARTPFAKAFDDAFGAEDPKDVEVTEHYISEALCKAGDFTTLGVFLRALGYTEDEVLACLRDYHANSRPDVESFLNAVLSANIDTNTQAVVAATKAVLSVYRPF